MATESNEQGNQVKSRNYKEHDYKGVILERKLNLFDHICRMEDTRLVKDVVFGITEGICRRGRPNRDWLDDIEEWCHIHTLSRKAHDRDLWRRTVNYAVNTNGQEPMEWWKDGYVSLMLLVSNNNNNNSSNWNKAKPKVQFPWLCGKPKTVNSYPGASGILKKHDSFIITDKSWAISPNCHNYGRARTPSQLLWIR